MTRAFKSERHHALNSVYPSERPSRCTCAQGRAGPCWCALSAVEPPPARERKQPLTLRFLRAVSLFALTGCLALVGYLVVVNWGNM